MKRFAFVFIALVFVACAVEERDQSKAIHECLDECETNADCIDGLVCSEKDGHICVPAECLVCYIYNNICGVLYDYENDTLEFPICTFNKCLN